MDDQVLQLLRDTQKGASVKNAEASLRNLYDNTQLPLALLNIASHDSIDTPTRQSALTTLKTYISATWSPEFEDTFLGHVFLSHEEKSRIRTQIFAFSVRETGSASSDLQKLAASVTSKIASSDFPDEWPDLFNLTLEVINTSNSNTAIEGALRVLNELVDSGLSEEQFFVVARDLVNAFYHVAANSQRSLFVRALALDTFQSCFGTLEMVMADNGPAIKSFLDESLKAWMEFFLSVIKEPLPTPATDTKDVNDPRRGVITLKVQVVKTMDKLRQVYVAGISPYVQNLFEAVWQELIRIAPDYNHFVVEDDADSKMLGDNNLPFTIDALAVEELDFLQVVMRAPTVKAQLNKQLQGGQSDNGYLWLQDLLSLMLSFSRISKEDESMWEFDVNIYINEIASISANYTPRQAVAEIVARTLCDWLKISLIDATLFYDNQHHTGNWKDREAFLFLLLPMLKDAESADLILEPALTERVMQQVSSHLNHENAFVRAGSQLVLGSLFKVAGNNYHAAAATAFSNAIQALANDDSDAVQVACMTALPDYMSVLPREAATAMQQAVFGAVLGFLAVRDPKTDLDEDAEDVKAALITVLRDAIMLDTSTVLDTDAIDAFLNVASHAGDSPFLIEQVTEAFEGIVSSIAYSGPEPFTKLCSKTIPALAGAFDTSRMNEEPDVTMLAAMLTSLLAENGRDPLPDGFVAAFMPKLRPILMERTEDSLVQPATTAVQYMLEKGTAQFVQWKDASGTSSLEVVLTIINRLLNTPEVDELAAQEVGGLASAVVEKYGAEQLGPYLMDLLRALASRLAYAEKIQFIQSICMVFVKLSETAPKDVVDFLHQLNINNQDGLTVVLPKWLENSVVFAGFDEVRHNIVALSKIFSLQDPRVKQIGVKGELIIENTGRIKTRSQAKRNPDRYTTIPADVKILKSLVDELSTAAVSRFDNLGTAGGLDDSDGEGDGEDNEWEDEPAAIDLGSKEVREELMAWGAGSPTASRARDEDTAEYLQQWFRQEGAKPEFQQMFDQLSQIEQEKLRSLVG